MTAGLGAGKTLSGAAKALHLSAINGQNVAGLVVAQSHDALRRTVLRTIFLLLRQYGARYTYNKNERVLQWDGGGPIWFSSAERPELLSGTSVGWLWLDESAIQDPTIMEFAGARVRDPAARVLQTFHTSTFNGMNWFYDRVNARDEKTGERVVRQIKATTKDNKSLGEKYVNYIKSLFPDPNMQRQALDGEAMERQGTIFTLFSDDAHVQKITPEIRRNGRIICGGDFNVDHMVTIIGFLFTSPRPWIHWAKEVVTTGGTTTNKHWGEVSKWLRSQNLARPQMMRVNQYGPYKQMLCAVNGSGPVMAVVDASSKNRHPSASETDEAHVRNAGFHVVMPEANPLVWDRISTSQQWFQNRDMVFDPDGCQASITAFKRHSYLPRTTEPQKKWRHGELPCDHYTDAATYPASYLNPIELRVGVTTS